MKCNMNFEAILIGAKEVEYKFDDGKETKVYALALEQDDDVGNVPCEKETFDKVKAGVYPKYSVLRFFAVYDTDRKRVKVFDIGKLEKK